MSAEERYPTAESTEDFARNLARVRARMDAAAARAGRKGDRVRLLPVSKTVPAERIRLAAAAGCTRLGENKVQEADRKHSELADLPLEWAIIGHLQRNKAREVAGFAAEFHALDSLRLAEALQRRLVAAERTLDVYVQVNTSGEASKYGLAPEELAGFLRELPAFDRLRGRGLMTLAVLSADAERVRGCFRLLRELRDRTRQEEPDLLGPGELSMGMSGDFETAIEEGADVVRVGQAIFGARATSDAHYWPAEG
ncbi:YggS family pyridoxal phosphate-dependent enzyme [Brevibacterium sp. BRM-1]|uniref:YggS family pyridoxal phosphate-dependent enzyme n=1 Tax=Brevibacterium sp. BRM-1 TaxID=2999062 RepID=UPI00227DF606|nr:YggS family pyridoxal phosphate-dependent enzyme [Brevibacterium sp. BRM-1]WAL40558.1 YggS family pyridoxal phosphate-dependent enzyme [Brevibacterium sp. BRM-1]